MITTDYLRIIYSGIVENYTHLSEYIQREQKRAEKELVKADEFFERLTEALNKVKNEFQAKHGINLNNYYMRMNRDEAAPEGQKYYYPKELPDIKSIGLPLLHLTQGIYPGHLYLNQVENFEEKMNEVKNDNSDKPAETKKTIGLKHLTRITKALYLRKYAEDVNTMAYYEKCLKNIKPDISINTGLKELPAIFSIIERWDNILKERLLNAPSSKLATELFKEELKSTIVYDENADIDNSHSNYWNQFRKIGYEYHTKGQNVTLQGLGYLFLRHISERSNEGDFIRGVSNVFDVEGILESLAEGVALAEYLHSESKLHGFMDEIVQSEQSENRNKIASENDFVIKFLGEYKNVFNSETEYYEAVRLIHEYFQLGKVKIKKPIFIKNGNIRNIAFVMGEIWRSQKNEVITYEYLMLYKKIFTIFQKHEITKDQFYSNLLYKYSLSKA